MLYYLFSCFSCSTISFQARQQCIHMTEDKQLTLNVKVDGPWGWNWAVHANDPKWADKKSKGRKLSDLWDINSGPSTFELNLWSQRSVKIDPVSHLHHCPFGDDSGRSWWDSNLIPKFTKIFEYSKDFRFIVFVIQNNAYWRNLSPWARSRAEKSHWTTPNFRLGQTPFKIIIFQKIFFHRDQGS